MSAVFLINRIPSHVLNNKSPYQILMNKLPDYHSLRSFGCLCYKSTSPKGRTKFDPRAKACIFLGYPIGYKGYRLLDLETNGISISRHVIFHETIFPFADSSISDTAKAFFPCLAHPDDSVPSVPSSSSETSSPAPSPSDVGLPFATTSRLKKKPSYLQDYLCNSVHSLYPLSNFLSYHKLSPSHFSFINSSVLTTPSTFKEAKKSEFWCKAMDDEFDSLENLDTWSVCSLPDGKSTIGCRWIFKLKLNADGTVERPKGRVVAKGNTQQEGVDFVDTFFPSC